MLMMERNMSYIAETGNGTAKACHHYELMQAYLGTSETIAWSIIGMLTLCLNVNCIVRLIKTSKTVTGHEIYLISLLTSNSLVGISIHPIMAYMAHTKTQSCHVRLASIVLSICMSNASALSTLAIAINRYRSFNFRRNRVMNAIQITKMNANKHIFVVAMIWLSSLICCIVQIKKPNNPSVIFLTLTYSIATLILYSIVTVKLHRFKRSSTSTQKNAIVTGTRLVKLLLCVLVVLWLPSIIVQIMYGYLNWHNILLSSIVSKMFLLVPVIDPFCYIGIIKCNYGRKKPTRTQVAPQITLEEPKQITVENKEPGTEKNNS